MINIVLLEPEIPSNTGNIGRTCMITGSTLHLIRPLGFIINSKQLKRAGLDYWDRIDLHEHLNIEAFYNFVEENSKIDVADKITDKEDDLKAETTDTPHQPRIFYATTKGQHRYTDVEYHDGDYIMFGPESSGIPEEILMQHPDDCIRIPMLPEERSLNLANSVAIIAYEALRQQEFKGLESVGELHRHSWKDME